MFIVHIEKHLIPDFIINKNELKKRLHEQLWSLKQSHLEHKKKTFLDLSQEKTSQIQQWKHYTQKKTSLTCSASKSKNFVLQNILLIKR